MIRYIPLLAVFALSACTSSFCTTDRCMQGKVYANCVQQLTKRNAGSISVGVTNPAKIGLACNVYARKAI